MKASELRKLSTKELEAKLKELKAELFNLRFQLAVNQLENPMRISAVKKDIARVKTILTHVGPDSVQACLDVANKYEKELFLLTEMSHPGAKKFLQSAADEIAKMGVEMGIKNYVAPATRLNRLQDIRNIVGEDAYIISPGVGKQGGDGKKTLEISNAIIVGRSIYEAENPKEACESLLK